MKLIVDKYDLPAFLISKYVYKMDTVKEISLDKLHELSNDVVYYIHEEDPDRQKIMYYFNEIVEIGNNLIYINKRRKIVKYYNIIHENNEIIFKEVKESIIQKSTIDKSEYLPHLRVHENEVVIFPVEESDEEI